MNNNEVWLLRLNAKKKDTDLVFTETYFYKKAKPFYETLEHVPLTQDVINQLRFGVHYPIQFCPDSLIYLACPFDYELQDQEQTLYLRCQLWVRNSQNMKTQQKKIISENQLLAASKILFIPVKLFIVLVLATENKKWDSFNEIESFKTLKQCNICLLNCLEYTLLWTIKKSQSSNRFHRRLPINLNGVPYKYDITVETLITEQLVIGFRKNFFNLNSSLSALRIPAIINGNAIKANK